MKNGSNNFLVDTGSDITIIDVQALDPEIEIDPNESLFITGITFSQVETLGSACVRIFDSPVRVQVVNYDLPVPLAAGVLGVDYLNQEEVEISFHHKTIVTSSNPTKPIPFLSLLTTEREISLPITDSKCKKKKGISFHNPGQDSSGHFNRSDES